MDSSFLLTTIATGIGFFTLFRNLRLHQGGDNKQNKSSSSSFSPPPSSLSPSSVPPPSVSRKSSSSSFSPPPSSLSPSSVPPPSVSRNWTHHVFPSFRGEDVRKDFLSHIQMEFKRKGITPFVDNEIKRGEFIGPELTRAIKGSKIAVILLSRNYASSSWCLDELAEIMKCREELGQTVMVVFYEVDPSEVKKLTGYFGKVFKKTCAGKTKVDIERWRRALEKVATIAGYHSINWDNEADMIKKIASDISNKLNNSISSIDFDGLVGMRAHLENMEPLLCPDSDEVRMIGIWGPSGIGKTTIARFVYHQLSNNFQMSVFMENVKEKYAGPYSDDYYAKLQLQRQFMSQITNQKDVEIPHLGVVQDRLKDKKVIVVLDGVDHLIQLDAMAKEAQWFGPGSRIIITTQYQNLLRAHGINHIYKVKFPTTDEALQIFCMYAFGQNSPKDGFEELAWEVTELTGKLPLGLRVMGSHFKRMSEQEWANALPKFRRSINKEIESILKFSYDALDDEEKDLFLHIACFFNNKEITKVEEHLGDKLLDVRQGLNVLAEKSLISIDHGYIGTHDLLVQLGRDIVRKQSVHEPGQRQFLVDRREIYELLTDEATGSRNVIGIEFNFWSIEKKINISERAFVGMSNLRYIRFYGDQDILHLPRGLDYLSSKLRLLHWIHFPMTCLPSHVNLEYLVELNMRKSKLENLWEGLKPLGNLRWMNLSDSVNLKELPDLLTATNLQELHLSGCSSLVRLPSSICNLTNLEKLILCGCSSLAEFPSLFGSANNLKKLDLSNLLCLVEFPSWISNATNLEMLYLNGCSNLVELPVSLGNCHKLQRLRLRECYKLEVIPTNISLESLNELDLTDCSMLKSFPEISTCIEVLKLTGTAIEEVPWSIRSWSRLTELHMSYSKKLKEFTHAFDSITNLYMSNTEIQEIPPWIERFSRLDRLMLQGCRNLVSLPQIPESLNFLGAGSCESLERLDCSFRNPDISLDFAKCFKLNEEARDFIIQTRTSKYAILPGVQVPACFTQVEAGDSLTIKLDERPLPKSLRFKVCILLAEQDVSTAEWSPDFAAVSYNQFTHYLTPLLAEHLYIFEVEVEVTSSEIFFEVYLDHDDWKIGQCGVLQVQSGKEPSLHQGEEPFNFGSLDFLDLLDF